MTPEEPALRRVIGVAGLAAAIFNITVGAAIFVLPAHVASSLGAAAPLAYLVCAVATGLVALCFAEAGSRVPRSGGPYAYVGVALGPYIGFLCGVLLWLGVTLAMAAVGTVFADSLAILFPALDGSAARAVILALMFAALALVNVRGAALGSRLSGISTVAKLLPLIAFVVLGLPHIRAENLAFPALPPLVTVGQTGLLLIFAFFGMESALQVSGEVRNPSIAVPRAIAIALSGIVLLYVSVQLVAQGVLGDALAAPATAKAPLAAAAQLVAGTAGSRLILVGMIVSTFGFMTGMMLSTPRTLYALAADGYLPPGLAAVHPEHRTPHVAIVVQGIVTALIAVTGTYVRLALLADVAILLVYLACSIGAWRLRRLNFGAESGPFLMPGGKVVPWLAAILILGLLGRANREAWLLTGGVVAVASLAFRFRRKAKSEG
ncbi:MAG TPA: APC family permease [Gemmatimonadales bacterium]|nr:APC family permease [Gemmatimonadales bacterium]